MADFFDANIDGEQDDVDKSFRVDAGKEIIVFLVDASSEMHAKAGFDGAEGYSKDDTFLDLAVKVIREFMKQHIIGSPKDQMAVLFYGAKEETQNTSSFPSIHTFQGLKELTAQRIRDMDTLLGKGFEERIGAAEAVSGDDLRDGFWAASQAFASATSRAARRVVVLTRNEDPSNGDIDLRENILNRTQQLKEAHIEVQLFNLDPEGRGFSMEPFWKDAAFSLEGELGSTDPEPLGLLDMVSNVRRKSYKKRAVASLLFHVGANFQIAVKLYVLVQKATVSKTVSLYLRTNEVIQADGAFICEDTGAVLDRVEKFVFPKKGVAPNFPRVIMSAEDRQSFKALKPPGLRLLGFKPMSSLKPYHQLRPSTFVYPDEKRRPGSATFFIALHDRLLRRDLFALVSVVRVQSSEPRLAALVAQQEEVDENGSQVTPPGCNLIYLPYSDDLRNPEKDHGFVGEPPYPTASEKQVAAARDMIRKLQLHDFVPGCVPNPHLHRHFTVIEALALGDEPPEFGEQDDLTLPDIEAMQKEAGEEIVAFKDAIYGKGNDGGPKKTEKKRKAMDEDGGEEQPPDFKALAKEGNLGKLTLVPLKDFCKRHHLSTNGRKDDIVKRITDFFNSRD